MDRAKRVGLNEAIFRQVNEQIKSLGDDLGTDGGTITVICECGDAEYTERADGYEVVRKQAHEAVEVAQETDPRS